MPNRLAKLLAIYCQDHPASTELQLLSSKILRICPPRSKGGSGEEEEGSNNPSSSLYSCTRGKGYATRLVSADREAIWAECHALSGCPRSLGQALCYLLPGWDHLGRQPQAQDQFLFLSRIVADADDGHHVHCLVHFSRFDCRKDASIPGHAGPSPQAPQDTPAPRRKHPRTHRPLAASTHGGTVWIRENTEY